MQNSRKLFLGGEMTFFYLEPCVDRLEGGVCRVLQPVNLRVHQLAGLGQLEIETKTLIYPCNSDLSEP